jgi:hypothetical protein
MTKGETLSYLSMQISLQNHRVLIDMSFFVKSTIEEFKQKLELNNIKQRTVPGNKSYFTLDHDAAVLSEIQRKIFHTTMAKLLYLAKRAQPDILTVTSFLCTCVKAPTEEDLQKLMHT